MFDIHAVVKESEAILDKYMEEGGWVFLDNVHLMKGWLPTLERKLEIAAEKGHMDFRCFLSAEPIAGNPHAKIVPESILQGCIKISNEPPSDMKSNLRRAFGAFNQELFDKLKSQISKKQGVLNKPPKMPRLRYTGSNNPMKDKQRFKAPLTSQEGAGYEMPKMMSNMSTKSGPYDPMLIQ